MAIHPPVVRTRRLRRRPLVAAAALSALTVAAQAQVQTVTVTGRSIAPLPALSGFGGQPPERSPMSASVVAVETLRERGLRQIGELTRVDAALGDAYNAEGYWGILSSRGYTLDNRFNYRRDGLPVNAETAISLDNKSALELLKGTSGIQAGTSAPGGLVNLVVKRPEGRVREARIETRQSGSVLGAIDLGDRIAEGRIGLRVNAAYEHLDPRVRHTEGHRSLLAFATDWRVGADDLIEAEIESSRQTQPSVAGFSMLGDGVPDAHTIDPRINLNHQPWNKPVVMNGDTASLRWRHQLGGDWRFTAHAMTQRLTTDDRTAFPFGVFDPLTYECPQWCDRFAPDGSFTYWQYVSEGERRRSDALDLSLSGRVQLAGMEHSLQAGVLGTRYRARFNDQVFDIAGTGDIGGTAVTPPSAGFTDANTDRDERSTEFYARDAVRFSDRWSVWAGLRHTRLQRESRRTDPTDPRATSYAQSATLPWLALAHQLSPATMLYASWGAGLESDVAPNRARYSNAGQALPALKSRQLELGVKHRRERIEAGLAAFDIDRPQSADIGSCDVDASCTRQTDGSARHRGVEAQLGWHAAPWSVQASAMWLDAQRRGSQDASVNGLRPVNVPEASLRVAASYEVSTLPGLSVSAALASEGDRMVLPDNSARIGGWTRIDAGLRYRQSTSAGQFTWRVGVDNLADRRAWKESPYQFGHVYLYPLAPRTLRASLEVAL